MNRASVLSPLLAILSAITILLAAGPGASAQSVPASLPGITVAGMGTASAPAETALVVIMVGSDPAMYADAGAMGQPPITPSSPIVTAEEIAAPIVDALVAAGLASAGIEVISNPYAGGYGPYGGPQTVSIRFALADPTVERIVELLDPAFAAAATARLFVNMTSVVYGIEDCASLHREARVAAIANARETGTLQAEALDVSLGDVIASRDNPFGVYGGPYYGIAPVNSCTAGATDLKTLSLYGAPTFDPTFPAEVTVQATVELTFEIAGAAPITVEGSSTPAS